MVETKKYLSTNVQQTLQIGRSDSSTETKPVEEPKYYIQTKYNKTLSNPGQSYYYLLYGISYVFSL